MGKIISILNQKGGVGKTTTTVNLASCLALQGLTVLLVDLDPQGNASSGVGVTAAKCRDSQIYHTLINQKKVSQVIQMTSQENLFVAPTNQDLVGAEIELSNAGRREFRLKQALDEVKANYDCILIDCPPSLGFLSVNALVAADCFLVPLQCEYYALEGLSQLLTTASIVQNNFNPSLELAGVLFTMFDRRNRLTFEVVSNIERHLPDKIFETRIPRNVRLSEAPSYGQPVSQYSPDCLGAKAYAALANEFSEKFLKSDFVEHQHGSSHQETHARV